MARMPSMTATECEMQLGSRGTLSVNKEKRPLVRKWLVAQGFPSLFVGGLSYTELALAYNQTDGAQIAKLRAKLADAAEDMPDESPAPAESPAPNESPAPAESPAPNESPAPAETSSPADVDRIARLLADLMSRPGVDAAAVNALIDKRWESLPELITKHSPIVTVQVQIGDSAPKPVPGRTHKRLPEVIQAVAQGIPVLLVGPAGSGKSTAGEQVAESLSLKFYIQGAASGTHEYLGYKDGYGQYHSTPFRQAFEHGGLFCAEELDSGSPDVPLILNAGLANGHMAFPDSTEPVKRHPDFRIIANANTYGQGADRVYVGRTQLDGATIDRFCFVDWAYDTVLERQLCGNDEWCNRVQNLRRAAIEEKARIIISPRASINGAKMIAAGWSFEQTEQAFIWKGTEAELRKRILAHC